MPALRVVAGALRIGLVADRCLTRRAGHRLAELPRDVTGEIQLADDASRTASLRQR
jgi:hypothetical protein